MGMAVRVVMVCVLGWQTEVVSRCWPLYLKVMGVRVRVKVRVMVMVKVVGMV